MWTRSRLSTLGANSPIDIAIVVIIFKVSTLGDDNENLDIREKAKRRFPSV
jgi:hypothetical protein